MMMRTCWLSALLLTVWVVEGASLPSPREAFVSASGWSKSLGSSCRRVQTYASLENDPHPESPIILPSSNYEMLSRRSMREASGVDRRKAVGSALLGLSLVFGPQALRSARAADASDDISFKDKAADFMDQLRIELFGAANEFEPLPEEEVKSLQSTLNPAGADKAYFALGCYWGAEAVFRCTKGVICTRVGFMGGKAKNPSYENIGDHLEVTEVTYVGGAKTYERLLKICGRTYDYEDIGPRYERRIFAQGEEQLSLASQRGKTWSKMPVKDAGATFFTQAKMDHQAYTRPRCPNAAPNSALIMAGLKRTKDHLHYSKDCPNCALDSVGDVSDV